MQDEIDELVKTKTNGDNERVDKTLPAEFY